MELRERNRMNCKNCTTELTQMKDGKGKDSCLRCLKCHPMPNGNVVIKAKKENVRVDVPWTEDRIRGIIIDELENWHKMTTVNDGDMTLTDVLVPDELVDREPDTGDLKAGDTRLSWRDQAKQLDIPVYDKENNRPRLKVDVLMDIQTKLTS